TGVFWGLLKVFDVPRIQALENLSTALPLAAVFWPIHLVLVTGLLIALGRISILPALLTWAGYFVLIAHVACLAVGTTYLGRALFVGVSAPGAFGSAQFSELLRNGVICLLAAFSGVVLWMACALASAERLTFLLCLPLAWVKTAILGGIFYLSRPYVQELLSDLEALDQLLCLAGALLVLDPILVIAGTMLVGRVSLGRGTLIWLLEKPLYVLLTALVVGADMVGLGTYQTAQTPEGV